MPHVYIEARPKGRREGSPVDDSWSRINADHMLAAFKTQREAIEWARQQPRLTLPLRHLND